MLLGVYVELYKKNVQPQKTSAFTQTPVYTWKVKKEKKSLCFFYQQTYNENTIQQTLMQLLIYQKDSIEKYSFHHISLNIWRPSHMYC